MEIQSLASQALASRFIPHIPSLKFRYQSKSSSSSKICRPHNLECGSGYCKNVCLGNGRALKFLSFGGRGMKHTRRHTISLASKENPEEVKKRARHYKACEKSENNSDEPLPEEKNESDNTGPVQNLDWRAFRAKLFATEKIGESLKSDSQSVSEKDSCSISSSGSKWAHPLYEPEPGCVLIATDMLDGTPEFERTVVLLLHVDAFCAFGVIINRPKHSSVMHKGSTHPDMTTVFSNSPLRYGGPLEQSIFLLMPEDKNAVSDSFEEVFPGLYYGARDSLHHAAELVRSKVLSSQNFQFFQGYSSWGFGQLKEEISLYNFWHVASCSPDLIISAISPSSSDMWEEILQLMGDKYAELSRKPKQDSV